MGVEWIGSVYIERNPVLTSLRLPTVTSMKSLSLVGNYLLPSVSFPLLSEIMTYIEMVDLYSLKEVSTPSLRNVTVVDILAAPSLTSLSFLQSALAEHGGCSLRLKGTGVRMLQGFSTLPKMHSLRLVENRLLESVTGFSAVAEITVLEISDNPLLVSLPGLHNLRAIMPVSPLFGEVLPALVVQRNPLLASLSWLRSLTDVAGQLFLSDCPSLITLEGLSTVSVARDISLHSLPITSLAGLETLVKVETLTLSDLPYLTTTVSLQLYSLQKLSLSSLPLLNDVALISNLNVAPSIYISNLPLLSALSIYSPFTTAGHLTLRDCGSLTSLQSLSSLQSLNSLHVESLRSLPSLDIPHLSTLLEGLTARNCPLLSNLFEGVASQPVVRISKVLHLEGLPSLHSVGRVAVNPGSSFDRIVLSTTNISALSFLEGIVSAHTIRLEDNPALVSLHGLHTLEEVGDEENSFLSPGFLHLRSLPSLLSFSCLSSLHTVYGALRVQGCPLLPSLIGLNSLLTISEISVMECDSFSSLEGLDSLSSIHGLALGSNPSLFSLSPFPTMAFSTKSELHLSHLPISSLSPLADLTHLKSLSIVATPITTLSGLDSLQSIAKHLALEENAKLFSLGDLVVRHHPYLSITLRRNPLLADLSPLLSPSSASASSSSFSTQGLGSLVLEGMPRVTSLALSSPSFSKLSLVNMSGITSLSGLETVHSIQDLSLHSNFNLLSFAGVSKDLRSLSSLSVANNAKLASLAGLSHLTECRKISIVNNDALATLQGLDELADAKHITVSGCDNLENLCGLVGAMNTVAYFTLTNNVKLVSLFPSSCSTFSYWQAIESFIVEGNDRLENLDNIRFEVETMKLLSLKGNSALRSLGSLLQRVVDIDEGLLLRNLPSLTQVGGAGALLRVRGALVLHDLTNVQSVLFPELLEVGSLSVSGVGVVALECCPSLIHAPFISITGNPSLRTIKAFPLLASTPGCGSLRSHPYYCPSSVPAIHIAHNAALQEASDMSLVYASGVSIKENESLRTLSALSSLAIVYDSNRESSLVLESNAVMEDLSSLSSLSFLSHLSIAHNSNLRSIETLQSIEEALEINVYGNPSLSNCLPTLCTLCNRFQCNDTFDNGAQCQQNMC